MNVVITGVNGYIGSMLYKTLSCFGYENQYRVIGIDKELNNLGAFANGNGTGALSRVDLTKQRVPKDILKWAHVIFPLAGLVGAPKCDKDPEYADLINRVAIEQLVEDAPPHLKIIYPDTNSIYGKSDSDICTEDTPINPISVYGKTKYAAEQAVLSRENSCVLRLSTVFGMSLKNRPELMLHDFINQLATKDELVIYEPHYRRNFVHILDVVGAFEFAWTNNLTGVYNLGLESSNYTKLELANLIKDILGLKANIVEGPGKDLDQRDYWVCSKKILDTGYVFEHDLVKGIEEVYEFSR